MRSRRNFLKYGFWGLAAAAAPGVLSWGADKPGSNEWSPGMILRSARFVDVEMPPEFADSFITPVPHFFVRNHMHEPSTLDASEWRLTVGGEVEKPITFNLADLRKLEAHTITNTLECAGNGRAYAQPHVPGIQWQKGAVGTGRFTGPRMRDILNRVGVKSSGKHVMFRGLDEVPGKVPPFIRSIPIEKAMDSDTLIAMHINGSELPKHHGFPARALVPGWVGAASCKWITEIKVLDKPFEGNFMNPGYRLPDHPLQPGEAIKLEDSHPVTALTVKSLIAHPSNGAKLRGRNIGLRGVAWAGEADVVKVEISTDAGKSWQVAQLSGEKARYAWQLWTHPWKPSKAGEYTILSRATDSQGRTQPASLSWNPGGYLNNQYDQVKVYVEG